MKAVQRTIFRWRGLWMAIVTALTMRVAAPSGQSLGLGFLLACLGESVRFWAISYTGEATRKSSLAAPSLVTGGPYSLVRNPLYLGNLLNAAGVLVAAYGSQRATVWLAPAIFALVVLLYQTMIQLEQEFLLDQFGEEYREYCREVPSLWPRHLNCSGGRGARSWKTGLRFEWTTLFWWTVIWSILASKV